MGYYLDLSSFSLDDYKEILNTRYLIPSQLILRKQIDKHFDVLNQNGIKTMADLAAQLKTKKGAEKLAEKTGLSPDYLIVLRRAVNSHIPPARNLNEYPDISNEAQEKLNAMNITKTDQLFPLVLTPADRKNIASELSLTEDTVLHIAKLMDVTRLRYVSPIFATLLVNAGYGTVASIQKADIETMYADVNQTNAGGAYYNGKFGSNDMRFLIEDAAHYPIDLVL